MGDFFSDFLNDDEEEIIDENLFENFDEPSEESDDFIFTELEGMNMTPADEFITDNDFDAEDLALFETAKRNAEEQLAEIEADKKTGSAISAIIDGIEIIKKAVEQEVKDSIEQTPLPKIRSFGDKNIGKKKQAVYKDATVENKSSIKVLVFFLIFGFVFGIISGFIANSYHNFNPQMSAIGCLMHGFLSQDLDNVSIPFTFFPLDTSIFLSCFLMIFIVTALIGLLAWSSAEERKNARVGHEHGDAKLMTDTTIKGYIRKFME